MSASSATLSAASTLFSVNILITGATGYIGGSVLTRLLGSGMMFRKNANFTALVRKQEQADLLSTKGVNGVVFAGLDDTEVLRKQASQHDIVINTASASHLQAAEAILLGLADRKKGGKMACLIHTSGTSCFGDNPVSGIYRDDNQEIIHSDNEPNTIKHQLLYAYEKHREETHPYPQRTTDVFVMERSEQLGVRAHILCSPTIYGIGTGFFNRLSIQAVGIMRAARRDGYVFVIGQGAGEWDHVHIEDLSSLYELMVDHLTKGNFLPCNMTGMYFTEAGHHSWREVSERVAKEGFRLGYLPSDEVREVTLQEAKEKMGSDMPAELLELGFASRSRTKAGYARELLGWDPVKTRTDFEESFAKEWEAVMQEIA
ncbi:hypothetical protein CMUS01_12979 [Colletotrichum musicola]|uniref:NAD-dependent epimerase/dehydratase domain-containing protein n=1 Tax=Colletotrichum musicola TaxID=2175873 RepID=A0A8H6JGJ1_9PEZI|nr:hypothetical protein CMUS01_12979 [Colletotrichum musicola]